MKTLEELTAEIPDAPPEHERFRTLREGLEFDGASGGYYPIALALAMLFSRIRLSVDSQHYWLRWLEDAANAAIVGWEQRELDCQRPKGGCCTTNCKHFEGCDATWCDASDAAYAYRDWLEAVHLAAKGEGDGTR